MSGSGNNVLGISGSGVFDLVVPNWPAPVNVRAFSTTRKGGISREQWRSLNLGRNCGDDRASVQKNRILLRTLLPSQPVWLKQKHGVQVFDLDRRFDKVDEDDAKTSGKPKAGSKAAATRAAAAASVAAASAVEDVDLGFDAAFTATAGQVCAVLTADCLPVVFCNKAGTRVAVAHAGWRGLAAGVLEATVAAMGCDASDVIAWMGPAIGPEAFEVGRDVYDVFCAADAEDRNSEDAIAENIGAFKPHGDRWLADLYMLARLALARVGVTEVYGGEYCTYSNAERFFSYRRDTETGRMATIIWFEPT